jgi:cysteinyl-tRNA synthetase, unknown class
MTITLFIFIFTSVLFSCSNEKGSDQAAEKMQEFVINIATYARQYNPNFIIIPQNGIELAFNNVEPKDGQNARYMSSINGIGVEELFYNGTHALVGNRLSMLQELKKSKKILVSEFVSENNTIADAYSRNNNEGFICFTRNSGNYHYKQIPDYIPNENATNITNLSLARNFLYLINSENYSSKQELITAISQTNFDVVILDLFFNEVAFTSTEVNQLKIKANGAKRLVLSYINIGSAEKFRYYWKKNWGQHHPFWIKKKYVGYNDEFWVKFWNKDWQDIIYGNDNSYMKKIINAGFDGGFLDNVEAYYFLYHNE